MREGESREKLKGREGSRELSRGCRSQNASFERKVLVRFPDPERRVQFNINENG